MDDIIELFLCHEYLFRLKSPALSPDLICFKCQQAETITKWIASATLLADNG